MVEDVAVPAVDFTFAISDLSGNLTFNDYLSGFAPLGLSLEFISDAIPDSVTYEIVTYPQTEVWVPLASGMTATCFISMTEPSRIRATATFGGHIYRKIHDTYITAIEIVEFAGGDGSPANPFLVETAAQLNQVRLNLDKSFKQIAQINSFDDLHVRRSGWIPIGTEENPFTGSYDGSGYFLDIVIAQEFDRSGFFGVTSNAELKNIDVSIRFGDHESNTISCIFGNLVGHAIGGSITNCFSRFGLHGRDYFGGLVGVSSSTITNCGAYGGVLPQSPDHPSLCIGGLVGKNDGIIQNSFSGVYISDYGRQLTSRNAGGIAGINTGTIQNCVYSGYTINNDTITGTCHRIVATNTGTLIDNYAWDQVEVLGSVVTGGSLTNEDGLDIAFDDFTAAWWENLGFVFDNRPWYCGTLFNSKPHPTMRIHYDLSLGITPSSGFAPLGLSLELITEAIPESVTYEIAYESRPEVWVPFASGITATYFLSVIGNHRLRATATFGERLYRLEPEKGNVMVYYQEFEEGSMEAENPFLVKTTEQLNKIRDYKKSHILLTADIDLSGSYWTPIPDFEGIFDGQGHTISGLTIINEIDSIENNAAAGFFKCLYNATIKNLNIEMADITGSLAGIIAGRMWGGRIENCKVTGNIKGRSGNDTLGGIVGDVYTNGVVTCCRSEVEIVCHSNNYRSRGGSGGIAGHLAEIGEISYCSSKGIIRTVGFAGGIAGRCAGYIHDCYSDMTIAGDEADLGGIAGYLDGMSRFTGIYNCYSTGIVSSRGINWKGGSGVGGISGQSDSHYSYIFDCVGMNSVVYSPIYNTDLIGKARKKNCYVKGETVSDGLLQSPEFYVDKLGWDFDKVWTFDKSKSEYPILRCELPKMHDWNLRGVYPLAERGLMWGYWGTRR